MVLLRGSHRADGSESEAELVAAAQLVTPEAINFMATYGQGLVSVALTQARCAALQLPSMAVEASSSGKRFTVSVDAHSGITTGVSAADRAHTIRVATAPHSRPSDLVHGGHVFPLSARPGGVLAHVGLAEAAVDLSRLGGLMPAAASCAVLADDGSMLLGPQLERYAERHRLPTLTVWDVLNHRRAFDPLTHTGCMTLLTPFGPFHATRYRSSATGLEQIALIRGDVARRPEVLVGFHSACPAGTPLHPVGCRCRRAVASALRAIEQERRGVLLYQSGHAESAAHWHMSARILRELGVRSVRPIGQNPRQSGELEQQGIQVTTADVLAMA
jgi:3,4-dihydroxy 2-butanone 4-phosphate synthase / GTP cyclohydrolase II